jgi:hypothetical protein
MCTILLRWDPTGPRAVELAANRDELRERLADDPGEIAPGVFAGRDRTAGGTWLAVSRAGVAALTNVRTGARDPQAPSRGALPLAALAGRLPDPTPYNAFNLLVVDRDGARVVTHEGAGGPTAVVPLAPGAHVVDNEVFGRRSPRAVRAATLLDSAAPDFALLGDHGASTEDGLCHHGELYGTVSATVVVLDAGFGVVRYAHASGPPCRGSILDLTAQARAVVASEAARPGCRGQPSWRGRRGTHG